MFNMDIGESPSEAGKNAVGHEGDSANAKLDDMIKELGTSLWGVKNEQEYMQV